MILNQMIRMLEDNIINLINESELPMEVKRLIVADVYHLVLKQADADIINNMSNEVTENAESA